MGMSCIVLEGATLLSASHRMLTSKVESKLQHSLGRQEIPPWRNATMILESIMRYAVRDWVSFVQLRQSTAAQ